MSSYSTYALADLLDAFAAAEPVPGGGSASAVAGALGVSLLMMVASLPRTRTGTPEEVADLAAASARLRPLRDALLELVDLDTEAYSSVISAYGLPKGTDAEKASRREAIEAGMQAATDSPMEAMRACQQALRGAVIVASCGAASAGSDVAVAIELLMAALRGSGLNVETNVRSIKDRSYVARVTTERQALEADGAADASQARAIVGLE